MLRHLGLAGKTVIVDEVHAYDAYMTCYMTRMLDWLAAYRTPVILLSATLPGKRRAELVGAYLGEENFPGREALEKESAYPLLTWTDGQTMHTKRIAMEKKATDVRILRGGDEAVIPFLRQRLQSGGCAAVIVNTVRRAQQLTEELGFVHVGHECSFVYDVADLYKAETTIPIAFEIAAQDAPDIGAAVRRRMRDEMMRLHLLERMTKDIQFLLNEEETPLEADVVRLWDESGTVKNATSYGKEDAP